MSDTFSTFDRRTGARVKRLREAAGMSQNELVRRLADRGLHLHQPQIVKVEQGRRPLTLEEAYTFAQVLGVGTLHDTEDAERAMVEDQQRAASVEIDSRRQRLEEIDRQVAALQREKTDLQQAVAYYTIVVNHCEGRLMGMTREKETV